MPPSSFFQSSSREDAGDVELMFTGDRFPVWPGPVLRSTGWRGGTYVMYVPGNIEFTVEVSDGNLVSGFILYQSENYEPIPPTGNGPGSPQNFMSYQFLGNEGGQNVVTMITGGTRAYFKIYETVALNGAGVRAGGPAVYNLCDNLKVSENGLLCNDSDANLAAAGVTTPVLVGIVSSTPSSVNGNRLCIDTKW